MMGYARHTTLAAVRGLTIRELDVRFDEASNSIGMLLGHMAAVEAIYQVLTFDGRSFTEEEESRWGPGLQLGEEGARVHRGRSLDEYLADLEEVRGRTLRELARLGDDWLFVETPFWYDKQANNYFKWFHVIEDELSHRGQIRWLRRRLAEAGEA
ncbi:DUF664 domain-containing protein [Paenibacillus sp. J31TS4]|uniref:mycothiol transferase n=1 Tax=Paenibacillus sp. J31TS4 TaxID=2807195 RepID=UPI001BCE4522|nr:DUF664 domain-containing protein [Paenibacillus sp. J31TS4]